MIARIVRVALSNTLATAPPLRCTVEAQAAVLVLETPLLVPATEVVVLVTPPVAAVVGGQVLAVVGELVGREVEAAGAVAGAADVPAVALVVVLAVALE